MSERSKRLVDAMLRLPHEKQQRLLELMQERAPLVQQQALEGTEEIKTLEAGLSQALPPAEEHALEAKAEDAVAELVEKEQHIKELNPTDPRLHSLRRDVASVLEALHLRRKTESEEIVRRAKTAAESAQVVLQVLDIPETEPGVAQKQSPLTENTLLRFRLNKQPADAKLDTPVVLFYGVRADGSEIRCNAQENLLKMHPAAQGDEVEVPIIVENALHAGYRSVFDLIEKRQLNGNNSLVAVRVELLMRMLKPARKDAVAKVTFVRNEQADAQPESDPDAGMQGKMMRLLHAAWPVYLAYCKESVNSTARTTPFDVPGALVEYLDYDKERNRVFSSTTRSVYLPLFLVRYEGEQWGFALPDPRQLYEPTVDPFYAGLGRYAWQTLMLYAGDVGANANKNVSLHFKQVCLVQQTADGWDVSARGEIEENPKYQPNTLWRKRT